MARTPLIAGNWKLNLDHLEATHTVQKLAWLLRDAKHDFTKVEAAVMASLTNCSGKADESAISAF